MQTPQDTPQEPSVLIVEDEDAVRFSMSFALADAGYSVQEARDGREAVTALLFSRDPLVVLLDLKMPTISGADVLRVVAAEPDLASRHRYIVVTAQPDALAQLAQSDPQLGEVVARLEIPILPKPFTIDGLLDLVARAAGTLAGA